MNILVIDGQGGGIGKTLIEEIKKRFPKEQVIAVGTNATATSMMLKASPDAAATGENALVYQSHKADVILGPVGIVIPNALQGEVSARMAEALTLSHARIIVLPMQKCRVSIAGTNIKKISDYMEEAMKELQEMIA